MADPREQNNPCIDVSMLAELCSNSPSTRQFAETAIHNWLQRPDCHPVKQMSIGGGGTNITLPVDEVREMFRLKILAIPPEKGQSRITHYNNLIQQLRDAGLTDADLKLNG